jgi:rod shape-determining protein MreD
MFARRESPMLAGITMLIALGITLLPLPQWLAILWPNLVLLTVRYWSAMAPAAGGVLIGFAAGLALDILGGAQMGQHAFAFSLLTYLAIKLHLLTRAKPIFEQAIFVLLALLIYEATLWAIDGFSNRSTGSWLRWLHVPVGAILWPIVTGLLGRLHAPR